MGYVSTGGASPRPEVAIGPIGGSVDGIPRLPRVAALHIKVNAGSAGGIGCDRTEFIACQERPSPPNTPQSSRTA